MGDSINPLDDVLGKSGSAQETGATNPLGRESQLDTNEFYDVSKCIEREQGIGDMQTAEIPVAEDVSSVLPPIPAVESIRELKTLQSDIEQLQQNITTIADSSSKTVGEIRELHKLYHNEFASRLKTMQEELDRYHEIDKGRFFDGILGDIAKLYCDYESVIETITDDKASKRIKYLFLDIIQILEANGVYKQKSQPGDKRNPRHCQVVERIPTHDPEQHDRVVLSRSTGFTVENRTLAKELVDVYLFTEKPAHPADEFQS
jgi:molecular chaperone GrpE (heat shock protein)